ncbi:hypothetical protein SAMN05444483_102254 [Salegentibacter echinorum]|uniref:Uncharacterized protein n=1 Tax=Salegentibacter echinorum TaxID=1073325 RepID=A0A1M5E6P2_SALEC|nr:hypothetical protein SAMN05444483_102254 [Salegentibacter echinorum]
MAFNTSNYALTSYENHYDNGQIRLTTKTKDQNKMVFFFHIGETLT